MNVDDIISVPDTSFRLDLPSKFNQPGAIIQDGGVIRFVDLWDFLNNPRAKEPKIMRRTLQPVVFPPQVKIFAQDISQKVENELYQILQDYDKSFKSHQELKSRLSRNNCPTSLKVKMPKAFLGKSSEADSQSEWIQAELDRIAEETNVKIMNTMIKGQRKLMQELTEKLENFVENITTDATQRWIELHTNPGAEPSNSSDLEWGVEEIITRKRTDDELSCFISELCEHIQCENIQVEEDEMNTEIERLEAEEIEVEEQVPISAAGFRIAMSIGIKGGKLKHTLQVMSDKAAAE